MVALILVKKSARLPDAVILITIGVGRRSVLIFKLGRPGSSVIGSQSDQSSVARNSVAQSERRQFRQKLLFQGSRRKGPADKDFSFAPGFLGFPLMDRI